SITLLPTVDRVSGSGPGPPWKHPLPAGVYRVEFDCILPAIIRSNEKQLPRPISSPDPLHPYQVPHLITGIHFEISEKYPVPDFDLALEASTTDPQDNRHLVEAARPHHGREVGAHDLRIARQRLRMPLTGQSDPVHLAHLKAPGVTLPVQ